MKQVICIRKDLNMRKGKMCAQSAHASLMAYMSAIQDISKSALDAFLWLRDHKMTKICVGVDSEAELLNIYNQAQKSGIICSLVLDAGHTEFKEPTYTSCCLGPAPSEQIDTITGKLKLL